MIELLNSKKMIGLTVVLIVVCLVIIILEGIMTDNDETKPSPTLDVVSKNGLVNGHTPGDVIDNKSKPLDDSMSKNGTVPNEVLSESILSRRFGCWLHEEFDIVKSCSPCSSFEMKSKHLSACSPTDDGQDVHICGTCKKVFTDVDAFITHKGGSDCLKRTSNEPRTIANKNPHNEPSNSTSSFELVSSANDSGLASLDLIHCSDLLPSPPDACGIRTTIELDMDDSTQTSDQILTQLPSIDARMNEIAVDGIAGNDDSQLRVLVTSSGVSIPYETFDESNNNGKRFFCRYDEKCTFSTSYVKDLERHFRIHTGEKPYVCKFCSRAFNRTDKLTLHERSHTGVKPYKCGEAGCNYTSSDRSSLTKHTRIHTNERPYKCQLCSYASRNSSQLIVHLRTHTGDSPFQCSVCPSTFKINSDLKRHLRLHSGEKPYQCEFCPYKCAIRCNLRVHVKLNHSGEKLICDACNFLTVSRKELNEHKRIHAVSRPYKCDKCSYTTKVKSALQNHSRIHTNERPFACDVCGYSFKQKCNLRTHIKKKHPDHLGAVKSNESAAKELEAKDQLVRDVSEVKKCGEKNSVKKGKPLCEAAFACQLCPARFVREDSLRSHLRHHNELGVNEKGVALAILELQNHDIIAHPAASADVLGGSSSVQISESPSIIYELQSSDMAALPSDVQFLFQSGMQTDQTTTFLVVNSSDLAASENSETLLNFITG